MNETESKPSAPDIAIPGRIDVRRAFDVYVHGRARNIDLEEKRTAVTGGSAVRSTPSPQPAPIPASEVTVTVPERRDLRYHRNAGTWRDQVSAAGGG